MIHFDVIIEGRMKGKVTRGRKRLQMLSDVISKLKSYEELKREVEEWKTEVGGRKGRHKPAIQGRKPKRARSEDEIEMTKSSR